MRNRSDRRQYPRHPGQTLVLEVDGETHALIDISIGGIGFEGHGFRRGQRIAFRLYSALDDQDVIEGPGEVANLVGTRVGIVFCHPNLVLFQYVINHIANVTHAPPYIVKKGLASL